MHILIISNIEWSNENAFGNTISNWFEGMDGVRFSSIYCRSDLPNNKVCQRYYSITPQSILRHFISREKIGRKFTLDASCVVPAVSRKSKERKFIQFLHRHNIKFLNALTDFLFRTRRWNNHQFRNFILEDKPDIVFSFVTGSTSMYLLTEEIKHLVPSCKTVYFIADDVYSAHGMSSRRRIRETICFADRVYGISPMLCEAYKKEFNVPVYLLHKGCHFKGSFSPNSTDVEKITMVYAGNLQYGRDDTLAMLAKEIAAYNQLHDKKIELKIFSASPISEKYATILNDRVNVFFEGAKTNLEVQRELSLATFALHVESFSPQWQKVVRYSFSTKITDCMESGSLLFAVGPSSIASIALAKEIPGAIVADDPERIREVLAGIDQLELTERRKRLHDYALENYSIRQLQKGLYSDFRKLCLEV